MLFAYIFITHVPTLNLYYALLLFILSVIFLGYFLKIFFIYQIIVVKFFWNFILKKKKKTLATKEAIISLGSHSNLSFYFHMKCCWGYNFLWSWWWPLMKRDPKIHIFIFEIFFFFLGLAWKLMAHVNS